MKNNTKIRLHLSKNLFEALAKEVVAEAKKGDMSGGAYTEAVKQPKHHAEKKVSKPKEEVKEMETNVAEESIKEVGGAEMEALNDFIKFVSDNAEFLAGVGGIVGAAKWMASKISKDPEARKALDKATGAGSSELGGLGGKSFGSKEKDVNELFGFGSKDKFKKGDIVLYKDETTPRKVLNVTKGSDKKTIYIISSPEHNGQFFTSGTTNASEDNLKPAGK